ncbi:hypothetical protein EMEDMD4_790187 [Sinorhizobium medicae]|uniref:Uncharacterized protein n=1 Tax=Sinorhizobium medicae TaxID=110321 RepID=A0A508XAG4_9HYPH|nr:hypothetical protein EMEDMD4_790187 [Sinorhizobium medicae]
MPVCEIHEAGEGVHRRATTPEVIPKSASSAEAQTRAAQQCSGGIPPGKHRGPRCEHGIALFLAWSTIHSAH